jgi:hypothetical protein
MVDVPTGRKNKYLSLEERGQVVAMLLHAVREDGTFPHGDMLKISERFGVERKTVWRLWIRAVKTRLTGKIDYGEIAPRKNLCGRRLIYFPVQIREAVKGTPLLKRRSQRKLASALGVSKTKVQKWVSSGMLRSNTNSLKPFLTEDNKVKRVLFCLEWRNLMDTERYQDLMDIVHLDEKWFYVSRDNEKFILTDDEPEPNRTVAHKSHIKKVMFLCALARPRFNHTTNAWWDGKLGIWPVGSLEAAINNSVNRDRGAPVWKNKNVTQEVYRNLLEDELIPALLTKWPPGFDRKIRIQQDGAKAHIRDDDEWFNASLAEVGLNAEVYTQPANSPDLNVLDLGFFRAIQSANDEVSRDEIDLIAHVTNAYDLFPRDKIDNVWLSLQSCFNEIIDAHGGNDYKLQHMGKERLERNGRLPVSLIVTDVAKELLGEEEEEYMEDSL